jgi:hypothetical protein
MAKDISLPIRVKGVAQLSSLKEIMREITHISRE